MEQNNASDVRTDSQKIEMAEHFETYEYEYRHDDDTDAEVVYEDDQVVVVADHSGHELNEWVSDFDTDAEKFSQCMHDLARQLCDYDWSVSDPVVFDKLEN